VVASWKLPFARKRLLTFRKYYKLATHASRLVPAVTDIIQEFVISLNWLLPLSVMIKNLSDPRLYLETQKHKPQ